MPTAFPAGLDVFVNPSPGVPQNNPSHSQLHTTANDALAALEAKVGVNSSAVASSLDYKISHLTHGDVTDFATAVQALANVGSVFGRTGAVVASAGDYTAAQITNAVSTAGSYADPAWITSLAGSKISGNIGGNAAGITGSITESQVTSLVSDLALKAPLASPALTGTPTAPTAIVGTNTTQLATTAFVLANAAPPAIGGTVTSGTAGSVLFLGPAGVLAQANSQFQWDSTNAAGTQQLLVQAGIATNRGLVVKGFTSQTANLQEWQNSAGTVLASIDSGGKGLFSSPLVIRQTGGVAGQDEIQIGHDASNVPYINTPGGAGNALYFNNAGSNIISFNYSSNAIQIGNGSSFQFTSGTAPQSTGPDTGLSRSSAGIIKITNGSLGLGALILGSPTASTIALTVKGAPSQSANLQEWQDSIGTVLSGVDANGYVRMVTGSGAPASTPSDGAVYIDTTNAKIYVRTGGAWKSATLA